MKNKILKIAGSKEEFLSGNTYCQKVDDYKKKKGITKSNKELFEELHSELPKDMNVTHNNEDEFYCTLILLLLIALRLLEIVEI
jgi:hypothetical protein